MAVLEIVHPLAFVASAIDMDVDTLAVGFVIDPVTFIHVTVNVGEFTESMGSVVLPVTFVAGAIGPDLLAIAVTEATDPLAGILGASRVSVGWSLLAFSIRVVRYIFDSLFELNRCKVATISSFCLLDKSNVHASSVATPQSL